MNEAVIAGVFALVGVGTSGGIQTSLAVRQDWRQTRGAKREVTAELMQLGNILTVNAAGDAGLRAAMHAEVLPEPHAYNRHAERLAQGLDRTKWETVSGVYAGYAILRSVLHSGDPRAKAYAERSFMATIADQIGAAVAALESPLRRQRSREEFAVFKQKVANAASASKRSAKPAKPKPAKRR